MKVEVSAIVAMTNERVIGYKNSLPWHIPEDLKRFSKLTTGHTVMMGRKTYESLPRKYRPLPNRHNVVLSRNLNLILDANVEVISDLKEYFRSLESGDINLISNKLWVIGGEEIFRLTMPFLDRIYLTLVKSSYFGDSFFPEFEDRFSIESISEQNEFSFVDYVRS